MGSLWALLNHFPKNVKERFILHIKLGDQGKAHRNKMQLAKAKCILVTDPGTLAWVVVVLD